METVKLKLTIYPDGINLLNTSDHVVEISVHGTKNQRPEKPTQLTKGCMLSTYRTEKKKEKAR